MLAKIPLTTVGANIVEFPIVYSNSPHPSVYIFKLYFLASKRRDVGSVNGFYSGFWNMIVLMHRPRAQCAVGPISFKPIILSETMEVTTKWSSQGT